MSPSEVKIHFSDSVCRLATWRNVVVVDWLEIPSPKSVEAFGKAILETAHSHDKATVIVRVRAPMKIPPPEIRNELTRLIRESEERTSMWCVAVEGDGFWAAAHRGFSASMHLLSGSKTRMKIVATVDQAAELAAPHSGQSLALIQGVIVGMERRDADTTRRVGE